MSGVCDFCPDKNNKKNEELCNLFSGIARMIKSRMMRQVERVASVG
jgi:hypothetical protein